MGQGVRPDHKATNGAFSLDCFGVQMVVVGGTYIGSPNFGVGDLFSDQKCHLVDLAGDTWDA